MPTSNPTTEGPVKSLRQVPPGGIVFPAIFAGIALFFALGMVRGGPSSILSVVIGGALILAFALPAYILWSSGRESGIFVTEDRVEFRTLGQLRQSWPRSEVRELKSSMRGLAVVGLDGRTLREFRYRYWRSDQVEALARSSGLAPTPPALAVATVTAETEAPPAK